MNSTYFNAGEIIESNAPMDGGNSGGGIYDIYGNLIGIISICDSDLTTVNVEWQIQLIILYPHHL